MYLFCINTDLYIIIKLATFTQETLALSTMMNTLAIVAQAVLERVKQ